VGSLCDDCESILSRGGEAWVLGKLLTLEKKFPLYDLLTQRKPNFDDDGVLIYFGAENTQIKADKLTHFALGVFWKASVHSWGLGENEPLIELGPYSERIRLWLRSDGSFPENVYPIAIVSRPQTARSLACLPYEQTRDQQEGEIGTRRWRGFCFQVPGLSFVLNVGKTVEQGIRVMSLHTPPHLISVADEEMKVRSEQVIIDRFHRNRKPKAFWKAMEKVRRERGA
jgi:hypothetical protein